MVELFEFKFDEEFIEFLIVGWDFVFVWLVVELFNFKILFILMMLVLLILLRDINFCIVVLWFLVIVDKVLFDFMV